jgi:hypothetical protein
MRVAERREVRVVGEELEPQALPFASVMLVGQISISSSVGSPGVSATASRA